MLKITLYWLMLLLVVQGQKLSIYRKILDYGQNLIMFCEIQNCCNKSVGWEIWDPKFRTLFIDVRNIAKNTTGKYIAEKARENGYRFKIQKFNKEDLNKGHSCSYKFSQGEKILLQENDVFHDFKSTIEGSTTAKTVSSNEEEINVFSFTPLMVPVLPISIVAVMIGWKYKNNRRRGHEPLIHVSACEQDTNHIQEL